MSKTDNKAGNTQQSGAGALLLSQRERLGLSEKTVAESLKLTVSRLRSIESDSYGDLPSETYIRGYLRNYAYLINLDETVVLQAYDAQHVDSDSCDVVLARTSIFDRKNWRFVYVLLIVLALLWMIFYQVFGKRDVVGSSGALFGLSDSHSTVESQKAPVESAIDVNQVINVNPVIGVDPAVGIDSASLGSSGDGLEGENKARASSVTPGSPESFVVGIGEESENSRLHGSTGFSEESIVVSKVTAAELLSTAVEEESVNTEQVRQGETVPESSPFETSAETSSKDTLKFNFGNECWVKVTDAGGKVLFVGLKQPGSELVLSGKAPFRLVIGNVVGTTLMYNGAAVELSSNGNSNLARLRVGG